MKRKDRVALVISAVYFLFPLAVLLDYGEWAVAIVFVSPIVLYWGYRFIKGDISFIKNTEDEKS